MISLKTRWATVVLVAIVAGSLCAAEPQAKKNTPAPPTPEASNRGQAYYHYSLAHLYVELAQAYNRQDYLTKAVEQYKLAMKFDPNSAMLNSELAELYFQTGRTSDAMDELEEVIKRNPENTDARRLLGRIYVRSMGEPGQGNAQRRSQSETLKRAIAQFEKITELDAKDAESLLVLGRLYRLSNDFTKAEATLKKALALEPENEEALVTLAELYSDLGDAKGAAELLEKLSSRNNNPRLLARLGQSYEQSREHVKAADAFRKALERDPKNADYMKSLGSNLLFADQHDEAIKVLESAAQADPQDPNTFLRLGQAYRQKRDYDKALESLKKAQGLAPDSMEVAYNLALLNEVQGRPEEAARLLKKLLEDTAKPAGAEYTTREKSNRAIFVERLGFLCRGQEKYVEAEQHFRQLVDLDPDNGGRAYANIIDTLRQARDYKRAREEADAAVKKYPQDTLLKMTRASLLADLGSVDEAVATLRSLAATAPEKSENPGESKREVWTSLAQVYERARRYPESLDAAAEVEKLAITKEQKEFAYFLRGSIFERQKKIDQAEVWFRKALELNPDSAMTLNYLGYMWADKNLHLDEAVKMIARALEIDPQNGAYMDSLGWAYFRQNKMDLAEQYLVKASQRVPRDATIKDHLADVYFKTGRIREALREWQSSLNEYQKALPGENDPDEIAKVQKKLEDAKVRLAQEQGKTK